MKPVVLKKRREFLAAAKARRAGSASMMVQGRRRRDGEADGVRVGFTCSKKVGNAVARNRAKRRLRAAAAEVLPREGSDGWDYILIGRAEATAARRWPDLLRDLETSLAKLHEAKR
ncbi:MAG: ribonuclease P protein component [Pseudomonadota bacterium]